MKRLILIFIGIFSFNCFSMEGPRGTSDVQIQENEVVLSSIFGQLNINFMNRELRLHQAINSYYFVFYRQDLLVQAKKELLNKLLGVVKDCAQHEGATLDTVAYVNYHGLFPLAKVLIGHGGLNYKLIGNEKIATTSQEKRLVLNIQNALNGTTILYEAVEARDKDFVWTLLLNGADPNIANVSMITPLMQAASKGFLEGIKLLLEFNADPQRKSTSEMTALHYVAEGDRTRENQNPYSQAAIAHELISHGAALNAKNNREQTPLLFAKAALRLDIVEVLLRLGALHCLSSSEKELVLNEVKQQLVVDQNAKEHYEARIRYGGQSFCGCNIVDILKITNASIRIFETILNYDSIREQETEEGTQLRKFLLGQYQRNVASNVIFSQCVRHQPGGLRNIMLIGSEINGHRGIKRDGKKRLYSEEEKEDVSYVVNYPREAAIDSEIKDDTDQIEPKRKKQRTK